MSKIKELQGKLKAEETKLQELRDKTEKWDQRTREQWDQGVSAVDAIEGQIKAELWSEERNIECIQAEVRGGQAHDLGGEQRESGELDYEDAVNTVLKYKRGNEKGAKAFAEARSALNEVAVLQRGEKRTNVVGTNSAGGYLVNNEYQNRIIEVMKAYGGMIENCHILNTVTGADLPMPKMNETSVLGELVSEATATNDGDVTLDQFVLKGYKYSSKAIKLSNELIQDDGYNLIGKISDIAGARIGRISNLHLTSGDGSSKPTGVTTVAGASAITTAVNTITVDKIIDLIHSIDPAYRKSPKFKLSFNDSTLKLLRKLKDADGRPIWEPNVKAGAPSLIQGVPYFVNQDLPDLSAAGNKAILCGDWDKYIVRIVRNMSVKRADERYIEQDIVAFFGFTRLDGNLEDATAIKSLIVA